MNKTDLFKLIHESIKLDFEEISIWKSSKLRNTNFSNENILIANNSIKNIVEIDKKLKQ
jgi:hypothetical protein